MGTRNRDGTYTVTPEEIEAFHRDGFVHLAGLLSDDEVAARGGRLRPVPASGDRGAGQGFLRHGRRLRP